MVDAKLVMKSQSQIQSEIQIDSTLKIGGKNIAIMAGPCAVESWTQMDSTCAELKGCLSMVRGGVYKPRTSPYSFQGMKEEGLLILSLLKEKYGLPVVTEVMSQEQIEPVAEVADLMQVGSRNMQNYDLLKALGKAGKPVLLKRGLSATIEEMLLAAEYIASHGNPNIILCERGIRSFDSYTRNVLDLGAVVALKQLSHLPVIVDPSHACGKSEMVADLARAAVACGADGLIIECHPEPAKSVSDARQALSLSQMRELVQSLAPVASAVGREIRFERSENAHPADSGSAAAGATVLAMPQSRAQNKSASARR